MYINLLPALTNPHQKYVSHCLALIAAFFKYSICKPENYACDIYRNI
ncbi:hypothetical protein HMPREF9554_02465 [Treponema phagedenis F0421]|nr:hypothetical protein HMPREF9554_02465 [Treponema phagedenis F0421]